jgi:transcriptional regulator with XRE-family HTH domain
MKPVTMELGLVSVATLIRDIRRECNLTQRELAKIVGVHINTISRLENTKNSTVSLKTFEKIVDVLGYELDLIKKSTDHA